jgi:O-acetylserine/cysteine efflux transporter
MTQTSEKTLPLKAAIAAIIVAACWGGNFAASKFAMAHMDPFLTILLRFALLSLLLLPWVLVQPRPSMREMAVLSVFSITMHFAAIFYAIWSGLSVTSAIIAAQMGVPFSCLMAAILFKDPLGPWRAFGLIVAFAGMLLVSGSPNILAHWWPFMLAVIGAFAWACANMYMKMMKPAHVVQMLFWPALFSLPQIGLMSYLLESNHYQQIQAAPLSAWLGVGYSTLLSSVVGYGLWMWLITQYKLSDVVPFSLLVPLVGIASGVLIFGDPLTPLILVGASLTVMGVAIITLRRPKLVRAEQA